MRDCVVSLRVFLIVVLMALVLMSGTGFAAYLLAHPIGDVTVNTLAPRWKPTSPSTHYTRVDEWDGYDWPAETVTIWTNCGNLDAYWQAWDQFILAPKLKVDTFEYVKVKGVQAARGPYGTGFIGYHFHNPRNAVEGYSLYLDYLYVGAFYVDATASEWEQISFIPIEVDDLYQYEIDGGEPLLMLRGYRPDGEVGAVHVDECRMSYLY